MPGRHRWWFGIAGVLGLAVVLGAALVGLRKADKKTEPVLDKAAYTPETPLDVLAPALRQSDRRAFDALTERLTVKSGALPSPIREDEAKGWLNTLAALRTGFLKLGGDGRCRSLALATKIFDRFAVEEAPSTWLDATKPVGDLLNSGMIDPDFKVRVAALTEISRLWSWTPGRSAEPAQETALGEWKTGLHKGVARSLGDRAWQVKVAAVACLGYLPIDHAASPAIAYLGDQNPDVRRQVLISFGKRRVLLTEDMVLQQLYDQDVANVELAQLILKMRGLTQEQISLGRLIYHPKPELRESVIPLLRARTDIDPVVWLLHLSRDREERVRVSAVEALSSRLSPEVRRRLGEMATSDKSATVREAASKIVPPPPKTAALPPLPGSTSLNPKAN